MYILECILRYLFPKKLNSEYDYNPLNQDSTEDDENCSHEFMPVDSTGETLACIKCGFIVKRKGNTLIEDE
jgi:hypothetical protein